LSKRLRVLVAGMVAGDPGQGGAAWAVLQYVLGLQRLGHEVRLVEDVQNPSPQTTRYFHAVVTRFDVEGDLLERSDLLRNFDLVLNISGMLEPELLAAIPIRVYLDLDPVFNQLWHQDGIDRRFEGHTHFVTVGQAIGGDQCEVPTNGREWIGTLPPVVLTEWPKANGLETDAFTTVANFRAYGSIDRSSVHYGQKVHSLRELIDLPRRSHDRFVLAMQVHPNESRDLADLAANGWELADPAVVAATPDAYRRFVSGSRAEIGIAKRGYVVSRCGWFSDRSACYLASGRPVVAQETGFSRFLPTGDGLFAFDNTDGAAAATRAIRSDYAHHSRAARELAEVYFDSDKVLARLLERVTA
jgi:hypothetical protein